MQEDALHVGIVSVVVVTMAMAVIVSVTVSMMRMTVVEGKNAHHVDHKPKKADQQQSVGVHLGWVHKTLNSLDNNENRDQAQENAVGESRQGLNAVVPIAIEKIGMLVLALFEKIDQSRDTCRTYP